jgi:hypothetical protein
VSIEIPKLKEKEGPWAALFFLAMQTNEVTAYEMDIWSLVCLLCRVQTDTSAHVARYPHSSTVDVVHSRKFSSMACCISRGTFLPFMSPSKELHIS